MPTIHINVISIHAAREGGDVGGILPVRAAGISIHAAREGGDIMVTPRSEHDKLFQSTPPVKAATCGLVCRACIDVFQSTPPVKAATVS